MWQGVFSLITKLASPSDPKACISRADYCRFVFECTCRHLHPHSCCQHPFGVTTSVLLLRQRIMVSQVDLRGLCCGLCCSIRCFAMNHVRAVGSLTHHESSRLCNRTSVNTVSSTLHVAAHSLTLSRPGAGSISQPMISSCMPLTVRPRICVALLPCHEQTLHKSQLVHMP